MWEQLVKVFIEELKIHPRMVFLMVLMVSAGVGASFMMFVQQASYNQHLEDFHFHTQVFKEYQDDATEYLEGVSEQIDSLKVYIEKKELRQAVRAFDSELHTLDRVKAEGSETERDRKRRAKILTDRREALDDMRILEALGR